MTPTVARRSFAALERLAALAEAAGAAAMQFYGSATTVEMKDDQSPVTNADRAAHDVIVQELGAWDDTPVVSEESPLPPADVRSAWRRWWLVDPLDGTKEFIAGNGEFTVNVALIENGVPVLAVVGAPALGTMYLAGAGLGAHRLERGCAAVPLRRRERMSGVTRIVESRSHPSPKLEAYLSAMGPVQRVRLGSSLKFCRVAEGEADLYPRFVPAMEWDVAAGDCVFRYAGADARPRPSPLTYNNPTLRIPEFVVGDRDADHRRR